MEEVNSAGAEKTMTLPAALIPPSEPVHIWMEIITSETLANFKTSVSLTGVFIEVSEHLLGSGLLGGGGTDDRADGVLDRGDVCGDGSWTHAA